MQIFNPSLRPWFTASRLLDPTIGSLAAVVDGPEASGSRQKIGICKGISASDDLLQRVRLRIEDLGIPQSQAVRAAKLREDQGIDGPTRNREFVLTRCSRIRRDDGQRCHRSVICLHLRGTRDRCRWQVAAGH